MDANICDVNHLDADVLLPPRKRLLAGLKKQGSESDGSLQLSLVASSPASASEPVSALLPSPSSPSPSEFDIRLSNLLGSSHNNNLSPVEIVEASKSAAAAAAKAAEAARATAEEKAALAAKAVAAAKTALDLVASFSEETVCKGKPLKKNKLKKHIPVQLLYKKYQPIENCKKDEELARKLHRAINSSPRISKNSSGSDLKGHKHKKPKISSNSEKTRDATGSKVLKQTPASTSNGHMAAGESVFESSIWESCKYKADENACRCDRAGRPEIDIGEAELGQPEEKTWDDVSISGKKRGRVKLKKLPLSTCAFRDQANPKEEAVDIRKPPLTDRNMGNPTAGDMPLFSMEPLANSTMSLEGKSVWKCQELTGPECVKQNKVMQS